MGKKLNISFIQFDVVDNIAENVSHVTNEIKKLVRRKVDLIVLPELWSSGFNYELLDEAADKTPEILAGLCELAEKNSMTIIGSLPEKSEKKLYNTAFCSGPNGKITGKYQKVHLFPPLGEDKHFAQGKDISVVDVNGVKAGIVICFDIRFPALITKVATQGISVLVVCAQWPKVRYFQWLTLLKARAIENQIFVIAANRCGSSKDLHYLGHSIILNPYGETIYEALDHEDSTRALIDLALIEKFREQFDCLSLIKPDIYAK